MVIAEEAQPGELLVRFKASQRDELLSELELLDVVRGAELFEVVGATSVLLVCIKERAGSACERLAADVDGLQHGAEDAGEDIQVQLQLVNVWVLTLLAVREHDQDDGATVSDDE